METNNNLTDLDKKILSLQSNIIKWYDFNPNGNALVVGNDIESISEFLLSKLNDVVVLNELNNMDSMKFNYIILVDCLSFKNSEEQNINVLKKAKECLKSGGIILLAVSNFLSLKFLSELDYNNYNLEGITKNDIENILNKLDINNYKFYYPLPNHKNANVIFTDEFLPNKIALERNIDIKKEVEHRNFDDRNIVKQIVENNQDSFKYYCNSFLVEISDNLNNNVRAIYYNNIRKKEFRLTTEILKNEVYKYSSDEYSKLHLKNIAENIKILNEIDIKTLDSFDNDKIISSYVHNGTTIQDVFLDNFKKGNWKELDKIVKKFKSDILDKLIYVDSNNNVFEKYNIEISQEKINKLNFIKYGLFDLIFQNIFIIDNQYYVYDQEWLEYNLPIEFILYRAILYMPQLDNKEKDELYNYLKLNEYIEEFLNLENQIQNGLLDQEIFKGYINSVVSYKDTKTYIQEALEQKNTEVLKYKNRFEYLVYEMQEREKELKLKNEMLKADIEKIKEDKKAYITLANRKDECLIEKENKIAKVKKYYKLLKVDKISNVASNMSRKIKGIKK